MLKLFMKDGSEVCLTSSESAERNILYKFNNGVKGNIKYNNKSYSTDDINNIQLFKNDEIFNDLFNLSSLEKTKEELETIKRDGEKAIKNNDINFLSKCFTRLNDLKK